MSKHSLGAKIAGVTDDRNDRSKVPSHIVKSELHRHRLRAHHPSLASSRLVPVLASAKALASPLGSFWGIPPKVQAVDLPKTTL